MGNLNHNAQFDRVFGKVDNADVQAGVAITGLAAVAGKRYYIETITLSVAVAGTYWLEDDDAAQITQKYTFAANGGTEKSVFTPIRCPTVNKGLKVRAGQAGVTGCQVTGFLAI